MSWWSVAPYFASRGLSLARLVGRVVFKGQGERGTEKKVSCSEASNGRHFLGKWIDSVEDMEEGTGSNGRKRRGSESIS